MIAVVRGLLRFDVARCSMLLYVVCCSSLFVMYSSLCVVGNVFCYVLSFVAVCKSRCSLFVGGCFLFIVVGGCCLLQCVVVCCLLRVLVY